MINLKKIKPKQQQNHQSQPQSLNHQSKQSKHIPNKIKNTLNSHQIISKKSFRQTLSRSPYSKTSQKSRVSIHSQKSVRSNKSSSSSGQSLSRSRLQEIRKKQKYAQQYRKKMLEQKIKQNEIKYLKAEKNLITKSRQAKIRSQISQRIVKENKKQLDFIKKLTNQEHQQSKNFQIIKNNTSRDKKLRQLSLSSNNERNILFVNAAHNDILMSKRNQMIEKYSAKIKKSLYWQKQYQSSQIHSLSIAHQNQETKALLAYQKRTFDLNQKNTLKYQSLSNQFKKQSSAQNKRYEQIQAKKLIEVSKRMKNSFETLVSARKSIKLKSKQDKVRNKWEVDTKYLSDNQSKQYGKTTRKSFTSGNTRQLQFYGLVL